jgi:hypothetical protein
MNDRDDPGLTIVGGRPNTGAGGGAAISPGLQDLLRRLAEKPGLARDLVMNPEQTLAAEGLELTPTELTMLRHLDVEDLGQTRGMARGMTRGAMPKTEAPSESEEETRRRLAAQLELVAPFVEEPDFYMRERTRGIRPQSIYPTPFAVAEALIRSSQDFRAAFMEDSQAALLEWPDLPLSHDERLELLHEVFLTRLEWVARNA